MTSGDRRAGLAFAFAGGAGGDEATGGDGRPAAATA